jgi:hypothetical protein
VIAISEQIDVSVNIQCHHEQFVSLLEARDRHTATSQWSGQLLRKMNGSPSVNARLPGLALSSSDIPIGIDTKNALGKLV